MSRRIGYEDSGEDMGMDNRQDNTYKLMQDSDHGPAINIKAHLLTLEESLNISNNEIMEFKRQKDL
jgi:hypothetical protein